MLIPGITNIGFDAMLWSNHSWSILSPRNYKQVLPMQILQVKFGLILRNDSLKELHLGCMSWSEQLLYYNKKNHLSPYTMANWKVCGVNYKVSDQYPYALMVQERRYRKCLRKRVFYFLMGLDDTYKTVRSQILSIEPLSGLERAYTIITQDEK